MPVSLPWCIAKCALIPKILAKIAAPANSLRAIAAVVPISC
jgi:hypothetical protein